MSISKMSISMPESLRSFISLKIHRGGYGSVSEYFRELVRQDQKNDLAIANTLVPHEPERTGYRQDGERDRYRGNSSDPYRR